MKLVKGLQAAIIAGACVLAAPLQAAETVKWWDFLGGGDGIRMKTLIEKFNTEHADEITIEATTLEWGVPFYTKVQTSAAVGEAPDIMTYHASRIPLAVSQGILQEITSADYSAMGLKESDYAKDIWTAITEGGKQYAVPLDTHPIVLYYNKDILGKAGLLDENGLPKGLDGVDNFNAAMKKIQDGGTKWGMSGVTGSGTFMFRTIYSLMGQQDGEILTGDKFLVGDNAKKLENSLQVVQDWVTGGYMAGYTAYPAANALFTSGDAAMLINGVWEVPTMTDLHKKGELFEWGAVELPTFFDHPSTYADSHTFALPANKGKDMSPEKRAAVLEVMSWISKNSLFWATAGHIPAYGPVVNSAEFKAMQPNAAYAGLTANMIFDPKSKFAGIAGPMYESVASYFTPTQNGEMKPADAVKSLIEELNDL